MVLSCLLSFIRVDTMREMMRVSSHRSRFGTGFVSKMSANDADALFTERRTFFSSRAVRWGGCLPDAMKFCNVSWKSRLGLKPAFLSFSIVVLLLFRFGLGKTASALLAEPSSPLARSGHIDTEFARPWTSTLGADFSSITYLLHFSPLTSMIQQYHTTICLSRGQITEIPTTLRNHRQGITIFSIFSKTTGGLDKISRSC